jgi:hypothetical protein
MPQLIVDPDNRGDPVGQKSIARLDDQRTRTLGFVPDLGRCKAGDLILSRSVSPGFVDNRIASSQGTAGFASEHARWTHAAVYLYEDFIVEADPWRGVHSRSFYLDVPSNIFRVRRRPDLTDEQRYQIALCALRMLGFRYDFGRALSLGLRALKVLLLRTPWYRYRETRRATFICSTVFFDAHTEITRHLFAGCPVSDVVMPAHLSATPDLEDIFVPWLQLT